MKKNKLFLFILILFSSFFVQSVLAQGLTTAAINGIVVDNTGESLPGANVVAIHEPSGTRYGAATRINGLYNILNMRVGGPYTVTVSYVGFEQQKLEDVYLRLGQNLKLEFTLQSEALELGEIVVSAEQDDVMNSTKTGAATYINPDEIQAMPTVKRSTRDLTRLDPRSDGNFSFGGKNWLYNNISLDGSYFNNPFGLDDPAPGGQANAEPVPYDAVEQVQVSIAPFDVREGGFTGAGINTVTKSGTNTFKGSIYSFIRNEDMVGNTVKGTEIVANPDLMYNQSGFSLSGPIIPNKLFFFINGEMEKREDPGTNFIADRDGNLKFGESRVSASTMDQIRQVMMDVYNYDTGPYENYIHETKNTKFLAKLDWNINDNNNLSFRYNMLDASRDLGPHGFVLSYNNTGRGPNSSSLPFKNSGYTINNELNSFALELNSNYDTFSNKFFVSYSMFRDFREPFSEDFPTIDIGEGGVTYTTLGHEPFSIHNILDQNVLQITNNFSYYAGNHIITVGATYEYFDFFNSFNIFRHGVFFLDASWAGFLGGARFNSLEEFFTMTNPDNDNFYDFRSTVGSGYYKGEFIEVAQMGFYAQDEWVMTDDFTLTIGLRADIPIYITEPVDNPFSRGLTLLDENDNPETLDQSKLPDSSPLFSPRLGFNWDVYGDESFKVRGGTGIFTGRIPFVWYGNNISNPGQNPNLYPADGGQVIETQDESVLQQSFDLNAMVDDFKWPQVWNTNLAFDKVLAGGWVGTLELVYGKDINAIYVRNADIKTPERYLNDGRPYFGGPGGAAELNEAYPGEGAGVYVIDNTDEGYNFNATVQLKKQWDSGLNTTFAYSYTNAKNAMRSTEIASVLWQANPTQGDPNKPELGWSEFGHRHRIIGGATYRHKWSEATSTTIGVFFEMAEGNRYVYNGGNRYSFIYSGDVNGDGQGGNDLIYIPKTRDEINLQDYTDADGNLVTANEQWILLDAFIKQDRYLKKHRGEIAERFGAVNPWYNNIDVKIMQDFSLKMAGKTHTFQLSLDILNFGNLLNDEWGVRKIASAAATSPLTLVGWDNAGEPIFNFNTSVRETYVDDPSIFSRWQMQLGLRYFFE